MKASRSTSSLGICGCQAINISRPRAEITMPNLIQLRTAAREIFDETLRAVDAGQALRREVLIRGSRLKICDVELDVRDKKIYSIAIGKAAASMAYALEQQLGQSFTGGFMSGPLPGSNAPGLEGMHKGNLGTRWRVCEGGHPLPNSQSLAAGRKALELLEKANQERALIFFLVSGGGSAMIEWLINDDITLANLRIANKLLINCGASISEVNAVRRALSLIKGGRMAEKVPTCDQITLIISDVPVGEECNVASGPTFAPPPGEPSPQDIVASYVLRSALPEVVLRAIDADQRPAIPASNDSTLLRKHFVLLNNNSALEAGAQAGRDRGFKVEIATDISDQSIESGCVQLLNRLAQIRQRGDTSNGVCLVSGGEFSCPVLGSGIGGRNLESALRLAIEWDKHDRDSRTAKDFVALCAGTDGIDGNSPAAGAIIDSTTIARARSIGLDPQEFLNRSDAYPFFVALGNAITTGPTGTNVRDLRILLLASRQ